MANGIPEKLQTLERALTVLCSFTRAKNQWGISELSQELGLTKSVIHRILTTMRDFGFVEKDTQTDKYQLGLKVFELACVLGNQLGIRKVALPFMQELAIDSGEAVTLTVKDGSTGVCIEAVESPQNIKLTTSLGSRLPLHSGGSKKVLLAFQPTEYIENYLRTEKLVHIGDNSLVDQEVLKEELSRIRRGGIAVTFGEVDQGAASVAAPLYDHTGTVVAGLTVAGPSYRFLPERIPELVSLIRKATVNISLKLGYQYPHLETKEVNQLE